MTSDDLCFSASVTKRSTSSCERPEAGVTLIEVARPVPKSLASTETMPFASILNVT